MNPPLNTPEDDLRIEHGDPAPARVSAIRWLPNRMGGELIANAGIVLPPGTIKAGDTLDVQARTTPEAKS